MITETGEQYLRARADDVTIPRETAALRARQLRYLADGNDDRLALYADDLRAVADLLDPPPTRLHERVVDLLQHPRGRTYQELASDVVTVVADWLAAQPVHDGTALGLWALAPRQAQHDYDVHLLRGES